MKGTLDFIISKDAMRVRAAVLPMGEDVMTEQFILDELRKIGVKAGIDKTKIKQLLEEKIYRQEYILAQGKEASKGMEGYYEFFFKTDLKPSEPVIKEDGSVDYSVKHEVTIAGNKLAEYHPARSGNFGYTVFATVIAPLPVKEALPLVIKGVERKENIFYALNDGQIIYKGNYLEVHKELMIRGDAGYGTGSMEFLGDIHITGDVLTDVSIKAEGNVVVEGIVEGARIIAGKDIVVKHGVHGKEKAYLKAGGSIIANFIDAAHVEACDSISVDHMINSEAIGARKFRAYGKKGSIIGGTVKSSECVEAKTIGNELGIKTEIEVNTQADASMARSRIIVHNRVCDGASLYINGVKVSSSKVKQGEYHLIDGEIQRFNVGEFEYIKPIGGKNGDLPVILLVDDEPMILRTFYGFLHDKYTIYVAHSGKDALKVMETQVPDLVLLDYLMPEMKGTELLEIMRDNQNSPLYDVPVYFVTSVVDKDVIKKCMSLYPQGYLIKPLEKEELLNVVNDFFVRKNK